MTNKHPSLTVNWMYPDLMNTYGDRGNVIALKMRCLWRKIQVDIISHTLESCAEDLKDSDLIFMGGAQDSQQKLVSRDLYKKKGETLKKLVENGIPGLFICGAYQFLGHYYQPAEGPKIPGLSIFDIKTIHFGLSKPRAIGNIVLKWNKEILVGFENHGGRTYLGHGVKSLGLVVKGYGNNGEDQTEGVIYKNAIGTYLHGPILPKNPKLSDWLISKALERKYQQEINLEPLDDRLETQAHDFILRRLGST